MHNPTRRNRNIGTSRHGHGQANTLTIPGPCNTAKTFYERLEEYEKSTMTINGHDFTFVTEHTRGLSQHACSVADVAEIIAHIPAQDYGDLRLIVFRQPKRKEETLSPVWGRLAYSYAFEDDFCPTIILEATDYSRKLKWPVRLSVDAQKEFERLQADGHAFRREARHFVAELTPEHVRNTQLYRTLPHEFGHYVHYLEVVERPSLPDEADEEREKREELYFALPSAEKERFAHRYADRFRDRLTEQGVIPFQIS